MAHTTSIHSLNGDKGLTRLQKKVYFLLNRLNNAFPNANLDQNFIVKDFVQLDFDQHWTAMGSSKMSPGRRLSNLFWLCLPWDRIQEELGEIHILDTGCGKGGYGKSLIDYSNNRIASYTGIDLQPRPEWTELEKQYPNFRFQSASSDAIKTHIPASTSFVMSQSAIEHFENDLSYFEQI